MGQSKLNLCGVGFGMDTNGKARVGNARFTALPGRFAQHQFAAMCLLFAGGSVAIRLLPRSTLFSCGLFRPRHAPQPKQRQRVYVLKAEAG